MRKVRIAMLVSTIATILTLWGAAAYALVAYSPTKVTRPLKVVIEIDPNDQGTAKFRCHFHAVTGNGGRTFIFTHCKHGL